MRLQFQCRPTLKLLPEEEKPGTCLNGVFNVKYILQVNIMCLGESHSHLYANFVSPDKCVQILGSPGSGARC